jgi:carboxylesterase type B
VLTYLQETGGYYNFSNIRYAAPPLGDLRFRAPQKPATDRTVDDGSVGRICPQASPSWEGIAAEFLPEYLQGQPINITAGAGDVIPTETDPRITEDCLFLDVLVPEKVLSNAGKKKVPVLGELSSIVMVSDS